MARLDMDHRWGMRMPINLNVQLVAQPGALASGWITDASVSGAFVRTELGLPILTSVRILVENSARKDSRALELSGYVVRRDRSGFGLEWWNLSPGALRRLFELSRPARPPDHDLAAGVA